MALRKGSEHVPSAPFANWLNTRLAVLSAKSDGDVTAAIITLANECGWGNQTDHGAKKLYKFRKQIRDGSKGSRGRKGTIPTDYFMRAPVEEALHHAGVPFADLYPEIAAAEEVMLEPDAWCPECDEPRSPIGGLCPFCEEPIGPVTDQRLMGERRAA